MKFCPECGNKLNENAKFCPECGYKISDSNGFVNDTNSESAVVEKLSSEAYIKKALAQSPQQGISISPFENTKKLVAAAKTIAKGVDPTVIIGLIDTSVMSSGKAGAVFTGTHLYLKSNFNEESVIPFVGMKGVKYELEKELDQNNKLTETKSLQIYYEDDSCINVTSETLTMSFPFETIATILEGMLTQVDSLESKNQVVQLENLRPEIITLYFRVIIAYLRMDDNIIDAEEYKELLSLMTKVKVSKQIADELRKYRFQDNAEDIDILIKYLRNELEVDNISAPIIFQSLGMDLVSMNKDILDKWNESDSLVLIFDKLNVDKKQVEFTVRRIILNERIYTEKLDNNQIKAMTTELVALATGAGISLGALAITGAVSGMGAGVSGGLWALAFGTTGGVLLGVATVAAGAYGAYKGVKYFAGTSELEKYSFKQEALTNRITMLRAGNVYILDDLNYLMGSINGLTEKIIEHQQLTKAIVTKSGELLQQKNDQIFEIANKLQIMSNRAKNISESGKIIEKEQGFMELESCLTALPEELNIEKFEELVESDINKVQYIKIINEVYYEDESGKRWINKEVTVEDIEKLKNASAILESIKYNETAASTVVQGKVMAKKGFNSLKSLFSEDK
ncbi:zinc-ribbon domain-containing protein [Carnobacterium inhibens]|uniref:zinc-ribbon domain-containing protein n=1 Tax=Carnobacterium inhibens TaxID=147709 RepID=UPI0005572DE7|nr:zinc-ribbon domain-containing protein [Carnobacterium inhibens]